MAGPQRHGILALCSLLACVALLTSRYPTSAAFERPIHLSILVLAESGSILLLWTSWKGNWWWGRNHNGHASEADLEAVTWRSWPWWRRRLTIAAVRDPIFRPPRFLVLTCCVVARTVLFWRIIRTTHCTWTSFGPYLPFLIAIYSTKPSSIRLPHANGGHGARKLFLSSTPFRYLGLALVWAWAARTTLTLTESSTGAICPSGPLSSERLIPLVQGIAVVIDSIILAHIAAARQESDEENRSLAFVGKFLLISALIVTLLACISYFNARNRRWALVLDCLAFHDLSSESILASTALVALVYLSADIHPSTLALAITGVAAFVHHLNLLWDDGAVYVTAGALGVAGLLSIVSFGLLLRYERDINPSSRPLAWDGRVSRALMLCYCVAVAFFCASTFFVSHKTVAAMGISSISDLLGAAKHQSDSWMAQAGKSTTVDTAATEYCRRYGIPPPPNFDKWFEFAMARNSPIIDDFGQIHSDLLPFWALSPAVLRDRTAHLLQYPWTFTGGLRIQSGTVHIAANVPGTHFWMMEAMANMIRPFAEHLPDMDFAINLNDECRVAIPYGEMESLKATARKSQELVARNAPSASFGNTTLSSTPLAESERWEFEAHSEDMLSPQFVDRTFSPIYYEYVAPTCSPSSPARNGRWWSRKDACHVCSRPHAVRVHESGARVIANWTAAGDLCHQPDMAYLHGFLLSPATMKATSFPFPVFSQSRTSGFADILIPSPWNYAGKVTYDDAADMTWGQKNQSLFWRGSASDGFAMHGTWQSFLRARFVKSAQDFPSRPRSMTRQSPNIDVGFAGDMQRCQPSDCQSEQETFWGVGATQSPKNSVEFSENWRHAHLMDLDGAGFSGRFIPFLESRSLVYRSGLFRSWFEERVHPWRHYVPVDVRLHELWDLLRYFGPKGRGNRMAETMAAAGRDWAASALRKEDMEVYMFRLLLEWGRLVDDRREELGYEPQRS